MSKVSMDLVSDNDLKDLSKVLSIKYSGHLNGRFFTIDSKLEHGVVFVNVVLKNDEESFYYPVEGRMNCIDQKLSVSDATLMMLDFIDSYFEEYLREDENVFIPIDWALFQVEGVEFFLKGQVRDLKSERIADQFLSGNVESIL